MTKSPRQGTIKTNLIPREKSGAQASVFLSLGIETDLAGARGIFSFRRPEVTDEHLRLTNLWWACMFWPKKTEAWFQGKSFEQIEKIKEDRNV